MKTYILDGYNVIHAVPYFQRQLDKSLRAAREALICFCSSYQSGRKDVARIYVVFDGDDQYADFPSPNRGGVVPIFSSSKEEADERIVEILKELGRKAGVVLVSNDNYVCNHARVFGVSRIRSEEFYQEAVEKKVFAGKNPASEPGNAGRAGLSAKKACEITAEYKRHLGIV